MKNLLTKIWIAGGLVALMASPFVMGALTAQATFNSTAGGTYTLKSSISSTQASITLTSFVEPVSGIPYTMSYLNTSVVYATINPEAVNSEIISFTGITQNANGSANLTGVVRGLSRTPGTGGCVASSTLKQPFPGQTRLVLSAPPCFYSQYPAKDNAETITGQWTFSVFPITPASPAASETTAGISQLATGAQAAAGTSAGSTAFRLVLPASLATSTWNPATAGNVVPVTGLSSKKIDDNFISTSTLLAATSTISIGAFPAYNIGKNIKVVTSTGTSTFAIPSGITKLTLEVQGAGAGGGTCSAAVSAAGGGGAGGYSFEEVDVTGTTSVQVFIGTGGASATAGTWSTFGTNGFYLSASGGSAGTNGNTSTAAVGGAPGTGSGGDINADGDSGGSASFDVASVNTTTSGKGGAAHFGGGSKSASGTANGVSAGNYGGGGSGASCSTSNSQTGGSGGQGLVKITW